MFTFHRYFCDNRRTWSCTYRAFIFNTPLDIFLVLSYINVESAFKILNIVLYCLFFQASSPSNEEWIKAVVKLYKEQFSSPYYSLDRDYIQFKQWAKTVKLPEEALKEVQEIVMQTGEKLLEVYKYCPEDEVMK